MSLLDEDSKEGRYFPSQQEQDILSSSIENYFSYPERSDQRAQIVQQITSQLLKISPRWNNRAVRLWFNNNKKTYLKTEPQVSFQIQTPPETSPMPQIPNRSQSMPPKKRAPIPRSSSVMQPSVYGAGTPLSAYQQTNQITSIMMSPRGTVEEQKGLEGDLTQHLVQTTNRKFLYHIAPIEQIHSISMLSTMPNLGMAPPQQQQIFFPDFCKGNVVEKSVDNYPCIECGYASINGTPAIVIFDSESQKHILQNSGKEVILNCSTNVSNLLYDENLNSFFAASGTKINIVENMDALDFSLATHMPPMLSPALISWNNNIVLGNRKQALFWSYDAIKNRQSPDPQRVFQTQLPSINSLAACGESLCMASKNQHSIHVTDGEKVSSILFGHAAAVTCLSNLGPNLLLSGSADTTARIWDIRQESQVAQLQRHLGSLTFISPLAAETNNLILTGGSDHFVRAWDIRSDKALFEVKCGTGIPRNAFFSIEDKELTVLTNEETDTTALGFHVPYPKVTQRSVTNLDQNIIIKFTFESA